MSDALKSFSNALASLAEAVAPLLVTLYPGQRAQRTAMLWQSGVLLTSEEGLPDGSEVPALLPGGRRVTASVAGRDAGTNVALLRAEHAGPARPGAGEPLVGALAIALGAAEGTPTVRIGAVHRV